MSQNTETTPVVSPAPVTEPAAPAVVSPTPDVVPVVTPEAAPVVETPSTTVTVEAPKTDPVETIMGGEPKKDAPVTEPAKDTTKPEDGKPGTEAGAEAKTDAPVELPKYEPFTLAEGFSPEPESVNALSKILGEIETGKLDHAGMQAKGQELVELGTKLVSDSISRLNDHYVQIHEKQKSDWMDAFKKDSELGGDNVANTIATVGESVDTYGGTSEQIKELRQVLNSTGVGNHPALIRLVSKMAQKINSYTKETNTPILPGQRPAPSKVKPYQAFYSGNG